MKNGNEANPAGQNEAVTLQSVKDGGAAGGGNSSHDGEDNRAETRETKDKTGEARNKNAKKHRLDFDREAYDSRSSIF